MLQNTAKPLKYVLANGDEKTITLNNEKLFDLLKWFHDTNSGNTYELNEGTTLFKSTILSIQY